MKQKCFGEYMAVVQRMLNAFLRYRLEDTDINASQFIFLMHLFKADGQSQEQLNRYMQFDKGVIARMAKRLERNGYITREKNPNDNRAYHLQLTQKAKDYYPKMIAILSEWNDVLLFEEDEETMDMINETMKRMTKRSIQKVKEVKNGKK